MLPKSLGETDHTVQTGSLFQIRLYATDVNSNEGSLRPFRTVSRPFHDHERRLD